MYTFFKNDKSCTEEECGNVHSIKNMCLRDNNPKMCINETLSVRRENFTSVSAGLAFYC